MAEPRRKDREQLAANAEQQAIRDRDRKAREDRIAKFARDNDELTNAQIAAHFRISTTLLGRIFRERGMEGRKAQSVAAIYGHSRGLKAAIRKVRHG